MFEAKPKTRSLGWAVVGCGQVAWDCVIPALQGASNARLVALCDANAEALMRMPADGVNRYTALGSVLADKDVQAIYIATPTPLHAAMTEACAAAGKHVLCEQPMAVMPRDALRMVSACQRAGVHYATAFTWRHHAAHRRLRTLVKEGALGTITQARVHDARWLPEDGAPAPWRIDPEQAGGGALMSLAPHGLDLLEVVLGDEWASLMALTQRRVHSYAVDDGAILMGQFKSGTLGVLQVAYNCPDTYPRSTLELLGTKARALASRTLGPMPGGSLSLTDAKTGQETRILLPPEEDRSPVLHQLETFSACVLEGRPQPYAPERDVRLMGLLTQATWDGRAFPPCH